MAGATTNYHGWEVTKGAWEEVAFLTVVGTLDTLTTPYPAIQYMEATGMIEVGLHNLKSR